MRVLQAVRDELSAGELDAIRRALGNLLTAPAFQNSQRYQRLLAYIVTKTVEHQEDYLKERMLGIEVFGRGPDYDNVKDPIVRVSVAALRKRLREFYSMDGAQSEVQISIPPGSYVCQFTWHKPSVLTAEVVSAEVVRTPEGNGKLVSPSEIYVRDTPEGADVSPASRRFSGSLYLQIFAISVGVLLLGTVAIRMYQKASGNAAIQAVWSPLLNENRPPVCVIGIGKPRNEGASWYQRPGDSSLIRFEDAESLMMITTRLESHGVSCRVRKAAELNLSDLRQGPNILIGAYSNAWSQRFIATLRFHLDPSSAGPSGVTSWLVDRQTNQRWRTKLEEANVSGMDYAIVARYKDDVTGEPNLIIAGMRSEGTIAAAQFVTDPTYLNDLAGQSGPTGLNDNFEVVIATEMINGKPGAPHIVATHFWK